MDTKFILGVIGGFVFGALGVHFNFWCQKRAWIKHRKLMLAIYKCPICGRRGE